MTSHSELWRLLGFLACRTTTLPNNNRLPCCSHNPANLLSKTHQINFPCIRPWSSFWGFPDSVFPIIPCLGDSCVLPTYFTAQYSQHALGSPSSPLADISFEHGDSCHPSTKLNQVETCSNPRSELATDPPTDSYSCSLNPESSTCLSSKPCKFPNFHKSTWRFSRCELRPHKLAVSTSAFIKLKIDLTTMNPTSHYSSESNDNLDII